MKNLLIIIFVFLLIITSLSNADEIEKQLNNLVYSKNKNEQDKFIKSILDKKPSADTLIALIKKIKFKKPEKTGIVRSENLCIDGVKRPFCWYIPSNYNPLNKTPLLIYLHGGVNYPNISDDIEKEVSESKFINFAKEKGYIMLFPFGQAGATWWDSVGVSNILSQIRITKQKFNIDDNRVFITGFSDGASGSFFLAMCHPNDFAGFVPLNGHIGVGSIDGGIQIYAINLYNRPLHIINTDIDNLYPDKEMRPMIQLAQNAGANLTYRIYTGIGHDFDYADKEIPIIAKFFETHPRVVNPPIIKWETAYPKLGRCNWLSIDKINPIAHADWYEDHNMILIDDKVMMGFLSDDDYQGKGVRIGAVVGEENLCSSLELKKGDIFIKLDDVEIKQMDDIYYYKSKKKRGDSTEVTILRDGKELTLKGKFPEPTKYALFRRDLPSARIEANFLGNNFYIRGSQVGAFTIYIHPDMIQLDQNVVIYFNDEKVFDKKVEPNIEFMLNNFLENRDRESIYINKISIDLTK